MATIPSPLATPVTFPTRVTLKLEIEVSAQEDLDYLTNVTSPVGIKADLIDNLEDLNLKLISINDVVV